MPNDEVIRAIQKAFSDKVCLVAHNSYPSTRLKALKDTLELPLLMLKDQLSKYHPLQIFLMVHLMFCEPGQIVSVTPLEDLLALPGVLEAGYNFRIGDIVPPTVYATSRFGYCVVLGEDQDSFHKAFQVITR